MEPHPCTTVGRYGMFQVSDLRAPLFGTCSTRLIRRSWCRAAAVEIYPDNDAQGFYVQSTAPIFPEINCRLGKHLPTSPQNSEMGT